MADQPHATVTTTTHTERERIAQPSMFSTILAIVGFILILVILIWGLIHIARLTSPYFSSLFAQKTSTTISTTPSLAQPVLTTPVITTPAPQTPITPGTNSTGLPAQTGPADLSVHILSTSVDGYGNAVVTFDISNIGGSASGPYTFVAQLPSYSNYPYQSAVQVSLAPGSHIVNTLRFNQATNGLFSVGISGNDVNESNNYDAQTINPNYDSMQQEYYGQPYGY